MKVLFDENLSPKLLAYLHDLLPNAQHVRDLGLQEQDDRVVWSTAKREGVEVFITTDADFVDIVKREGPPPKVVRLERADVKTAQLESVLRRNALRIFDLASGPRSILILQSR